jgi:indole-3-glycerol phosphate synthase
MGTYLDDIVARHRVRAATDGRVWQDRLEQASPRTPRFRSALQSGSTIAIIAEIKRKSPSKGWLAQDLDAVAMASLYESNGASAISVLTDEEGFGGTLDDLRAIHQQNPLPLLRKDFTVSPNDVLDAYDAGADAVLLIVAALSDAELSQFHELTLQLGLDALVEIHSVEEAKRTEAIGATVIGINQRNLNTFEVDSEHAARLASALPSHVVKVCESGLRVAADVLVASQAGFDAVLVGEHFVTSNHPAQLLQEFANVPR